MSAGKYCVNDDGHACVVDWHFVFQGLQWFAVAFAVLLVLSVAWTVLEQHSDASRVHKLRELAGKFDTWPLFVRGMLVSGCGEQGKHLRQAALF